MYEQNGVVYPDKLPKRVIVTCPMEAAQNNWSVGQSLDVDPLYTEEQYQEGGHYVNVHSDAWKRSVPLAPGNYKPAGPQ